MWGILGQFWSVCPKLPGMVWGYIAVQMRNGNRDLAQIMEGFGELEMFTQINNDVPAYEYFILQSK